MKRFTIATALIVLGLLAAGGAFAQEEAAAPATEKTMAPHFTDFDKALEAASAKGQDLFVDFYADW